MLQALLGFEGAKYLGGDHRAFGPVADVPSGTLEQHMARKNPGSPSKATLDNRSRQLNPNNDAFKSSRGVSDAGTPADQATRDNRSRQLNPNNDAYKSSRGSGESKNG